MEDWLNKCYNVYVDKVNNKIMKNLVDIKKGLSSAEVSEKIKSLGLNKIISENSSHFKIFLKKFLSPIAIMFLVAAVLSFFDGKVFEFYFILFLMFLNFFVSFWQEKKADNAIEELNKLLKLTIKVLRDGKWSQIDSVMLVPGDIVQVYIGDVIPADLKIIDAKNFSLNEAAVTGESLPVEKKGGETIYSGSFVATGQALAQVKATGKNTYFGKIMLSLDKKQKRSLLENDIIKISKLLSILSFFAVIVMTAVFLIAKQPLLDVLTVGLSLVIAGIPIALPTVLTLIISFGVLKLSKKNVIVRRLASLEDLANVDLLFTDKTGTLTKNEIEISEVVNYNASVDDVLSYAYFSSISTDHDLINKTIIKKVSELNLDLKNFEIKEFVPADSDRKRSSAIVIFKGKEIFVSVGAPQVIENFCLLNKSSRKTFEKDVQAAAEKGYRVLAVAVNLDSQVEKNMKLAGLLLLSDNLREDAKETINFLIDNGVKVKMLTGDHNAIAYRIGKMLGFKKEDVFSQILPIDKYNLVTEGKKDHIVAVTGDGINDLPAVKTADVGFAVNNAVSALKSSADIVLLSPGIGVVTTAIIEARKIFTRIYSYSVYRMSESLRVIVTIFILGLIYRAYPLTPIQLILLAILNDIPIVSLAFNRVKITHKPSQIEFKKRFAISLLFGLVGVVNSMLFLLILVKWLHCDWDIISTAFFLKLTVGGHLLVFVAHTKERWHKFLPSKQVIYAIFITQAIATFFAVSGIFMHKISIGFALAIWCWAIFWMQVGDYMKPLQEALNNRHKSNIEKFVKALIFFIKNFLLYK